MKQQILKRSISIFILLLLVGTRSEAQFPVCPDTSGGQFYVLTWAHLYNFNPALPVSPTNPTINTIPVGGAGLAINRPINPVGPNGPTPSPTFYTVGDDPFNPGNVSGRAIYYYDGFLWQNTGHEPTNSGDNGAVNMAGAGRYIYFLSPWTHDVFRYDGTGNAIKIADLSGWWDARGPWDILGDCAGNFYVLRVAIPAALHKYDSLGNLVQSYDVNGVLPNGWGGGGFAFVNGKFYYSDILSDLYEGVLSGTTIHFTAVPAPTVTFFNEVFADFASCEMSQYALGIADADTVYYCGSGPGVTLHAPGTDSFAWQVISGPAVITGSGATVTVTASASSVIVVKAAGNIYCGPETDTIHVMVPTALADAGYIDTISGCGQFADTLIGNVFNTAPGFSYQYSWTPAAGILSGDSTLTPVINPTANTTYVLTVSVPASQGGCIWKDSVEAIIKDETVTADFSYEILYGCAEDTVVFTNLSTNASFNKWDFADNSGDTVVHPVHIYTHQNTYNVKLNTTNRLCKDSIEKIIDTQHPLRASFTIDDDSICQGSTISFTNTSLYTDTHGPAHFHWDFGDGTTDTLKDPLHIYARAGTHQVLLTVTDFIPCTDSFMLPVIVDSISAVSFTASDTVLCEGKGVQLHATYSETGIDTLIWSFGEGNGLRNQNDIFHAYDTSGVFTIRLAAYYRECPDTNYEMSIRVKPFPEVDLGPDTSMCPNTAPILLRNLLSGNYAGASWLWNTGDTLSAIKAYHPGIYTLKLSMDNCSTDDSIEVFKDCYIDIPNAFTPNGDGTNDYFLPRQLLSKGLTGYKMTVFNRWGQVVFRTDRIDGRGWDGKFNGTDQPQGVYVYLVEAILKNGADEKYQGNVTLIR